MDEELRKWREDQKHLPKFMRDFHNCKELFKGISEYLVCEDGHPAKNVNWVQAHCYTIDLFLWFMAEHGYTLQRSRANKKFSDLDERLEDINKNRKASFAKIISGKQEQEK